MESAEIRKGIGRWVMTAMVSLAMSVLSVLVYDHFFATKILAVDLKGFVAAQRDLFVAGRLTEEQFMNNMDELEKVIAGARDNQVVIMREAVVRNATVIGIDVPAK